MSKDTFDNLTESIDWSIQQLETPRKNRNDAIKQFVSSHYSDGGPEKRVPTNFMELAATIYLRQLAPRMPRVLVSTENQKLRRHAYEMQLALNQIPTDINLDDTIRNAVLAALFSMGIVKHGICATGEVLGHEYGEAYVDVVSFDDYFVDMTAKSYDQIQYEGNDYWIDKDDYDKLYPNDQTKADSYEIDELGDGEEKANEITADKGGKAYRKKIRLRDVWLPREKKLVTYRISNKKRLKETNFDGPIAGPYERLMFSSVPDNLLPLPPVALWRDLHELGNSLFRKLAKQADSEKTVAGFPAGQEEDAERLKNAGDGEGIVYSGQEPKELHVGGVSQLTLAFYLQVRDLFSYFGGNLDALGGLAAMSDTVGQDNMMSDAAGARLKDMSRATTEFVRKIYKALAWYEWTDPVRARIIEKKVPTVDASIKTLWSQETRQGDFLDYNFKIDVYSMIDDSPSAKMARLNSIMQGYIVPLIPLIQQQGGSLNFPKLLSLLSQYSDIPELDELVVFQTLGNDGGAPARGNPQPTMAPHTTRTYERVNKPSVTRQGKDYALSQLLMGGNPQQSEAAGITRT